MFENYLNYNNIPSGAILERILAKQNVSQKQLADKSGILPQRVNDYVKNKRRFTVETSLKIEGALHIDIPGFFYLIQSNHDVFLAKERKKQLRCPDMVKFRKSLFWDMEMSALDWNDCKRTIIQRCFEYGNECEIKEIISFYGEKTVKETLDSITDKWKQEERISNYKKYL